MYAEDKPTGIDHEQAQRHLELLGYKRGDKIFTRYIHPDVNHTPRSIKKQRLGWEECDRYQSEGYDAYFVVNGQGDTDAKVKVGRAIFYEHDDLDKTIQRDLWQSLGMPEPTIQVDTGGKSIHSYWVFEQPIPIADWVQLQADLLEFSAGDRTIKNPSRIMRLAGSLYQKGQNPGSTRAYIISESGNRYSYQELRGCVSERDKTIDERPSPELNGDVSLYACLTKDDRGLIDSGVSEGGRNASGAKLARNLLGTKSRLIYLGYRCGDEPRQLFDDFCNRCTPSIPEREREQIWRKAERDNPSASLTDEALENCAKAYLWNEQKGIKRDRGSGGSGGSGGGDGGDKVIRFPGFEPLSLEQIIKHIDRLIDEGLSGSKLTSQINRLAVESQYHVGELRKLYYERLEEADADLERTDNRSQVEDLLQEFSAQINLLDYLPDSLATPITQWCKWLNIRPAVALTALLSGASSLHKTGTELIIHRNQNFSVPSTIYSAIVSPSGQKKSPVFYNLVRKPLNKLEREKLDIHEAAMEDYEAALEQWEEEKQGEKPDKPEDPTLYYFTNATGEAIPVQAQKDPKKCLLALIDELAGYFNSSNAYRNGRGSDKQDLLSYFDGAGQTILRAGGIRVNVKNIYLSILGTIQPEILKTHMEDCSDPDGNWARFLFVNQPLEASVLHDDDGMAVQISDRIAQFYRQIDRLPEMEYHLSREAFKRYQGVYNQLEQLRVTHAHSGMAAVYSKMEGYIGRLALNLHVLWELAADKDCPSEEIPLYIMEMAIQLARFYIGQVKLVHANSDNESLPSHILKMIELSKRLEANGKSGWIKAQQIRELFAKKKRPSAQTARDWMNEALTMGYGRSRNSGNRLEYHWRNDHDNPSSDTPPNLGNLGKVRDNLGNSVPYAEMTNSQGVEDSLGNLGNTPLIKYSRLKPEHLDTDGNGDDLVQPSLEGGKSPQPSLSKEQDTQTQDSEGISELRDELREQFPDHSLSSLNEAIAPDQSTNGENAIAPDQSDPTIAKIAGAMQIAFERGNASIIKQMPAIHSPDIVQRACLLLTGEYRDFVESCLPQLKPETELTYDDVVAAIDREMKRLGWTKPQGREYLVKTYGKRSRQLLTDEELVEFLHYLQGIECEF